MGKIFAYHILDKGLISKIYAELIQETVRLKYGQRINRCFSKEDIQIANRSMRKYSTSLTIGEMQIKTTISYHLIPVRLAITKKTRDNRCWKRCGEKETLVHC